MKDNTSISYYMLIIIFCIFTIAVSSIGIECYNSNEAHKDEKKANFGFLICNLVVAILMILSTFYMIYKEAKS